MLSAREVTDSKNDTIVLYFSPHPIYEPISIDDLEEATSLDSTMKAHIDMVYNTTGKMENYGVEVMVFATNLEEVKSFLILRQIRGYIQSLSFTNKHIEQRYIDLSNVPTTEKPYVLIRPFLVCKEQD